MIPFINICLCARQKEIKMHRGQQVNKRYRQGELWFTRARKTKKKKKNDHTFSDNHRRCASFPCED